MLGVYDLAAAVRDAPVASPSTSARRSSRGSGSAWSTSAPSASPSTRREWAAGDDYSHNSKAFADVILADAPYIDEAALEVARDDFEAYVRHALAEGYNAIAIPGLHRVPDLLGRRRRHEVYAADDTHVARALAMREAFGPMWEYAHDARPRRVLPHRHAHPHDAARGVPRRRGSAASPPRTPSSGTSTRPGLDELYAAMPYLDGVLIRIGEAGRVYDLPGLGLLLRARRHDRRLGARRCSRRSPSRPSASTAR